MDPHSVDPSLQKTLPNPDPAAIVRLLTEILVQAKVLVVDQLELVKDMQRLHLPTPNPAVLAALPFSPVDRSTPANTINTNP